VISLPAGLLTALTRVLSELGDDSPLVEARPVGGGCINNAIRLQSARDVYFLKWNPAPLTGMFTAEAHGLELLAATRTVRVPYVLAVSDPAPDQPAFILQEWLEPDGFASRSQSMARLGEQLARMHQAQLGGYPADTFGLDRDNYLGSTPQPNGWETDWIVFFRERRLRHQMKLAESNGRLPVERRRRLERLIDRLDVWLGGRDIRPSLLHGDLWGGNVIPAPRGELALIDPAVYFGDREAELAYTELFGGFSDAFYSAYKAVWPLDGGYSERRDLYNLYHLLNHLNLFGESYGPEVDAILRRYVGK
jgi:fructosamine-3-kinase